MTDVLSLARGTPSAIAAVKFSHRTNHACFGVDPGVEWNTEPTEEPCPQDCGQHNDATPGMFRTQQGAYKVY